MMTINVIKASCNAFASASAVDVPPAQLEALANDNRLEVDVDHTVVDVRLAEEVQVLAICGSPEREVEWLHRVAEKKLAEELAHYAPDVAWVMRLDDDPYVRTYYVRRLSDLAELYNDLEEWDELIGDVIEAQGWNYHEDATTSLCDNGEDEIRINERGKAYVAYNAL